MNFKNDIEQFFYDMHHKNENYYSYFVMMLDGDKVISADGVKDIINKFPNFINKFNKYEPDLKSFNGVCLNNDLLKEAENYVLNVLKTNKLDKVFVISYPYGYGCIQVSLVDIKDIESIDINTNSVEDYLVNRNIKISKEKEINITLYNDSSCSMHWVNVDDTTIYIGNTWDFHNGCNGCKIPSFKGPNSYVNVIKQGLLNKGYIVKVEIKEGKYDEL